MMMMTEQEKIDLFYTKLKGDKINKPFSRVGLMILVFVVAILCAFPAQNLLTDDVEKFLIPMMWAGILFGIAGFLYIYPYEFYEDNMKNRLIEEEIIKYHPIHIKTLKKMLIEKELLFYVKFAAVCIFIQIGSAYLQYGTVEWFNVLYILCIVSIIPLFFEVLPRVVRYKIFYSK